MKNLKLFPTRQLFPARRGLIVRDPRTRKPLSEDGELKPLTGYWLRRLRDGSVTETPLPAVNTAAVPKASRKKPETEQ